MSPESLPQHANILYHNFHNRYLFLFLHCVHASDLLHFVDSWKRPEANPALAGRQASRRAGRQAVALGLRVYWVFHNDSNSFCMCVSLSMKEEMCSHATGASSSIQGIIRRSKLNNHAEVIGI
jgi:hypothetical protein